MIRPNCESCPVDEHFSESKATRFCGDPTVRCVNFRGLLQKKVEAWQRSAEIAELSRNGRIPLSLFREGDVLQIITSRTGKGYGVKGGLDRRFTVSVDKYEDNELTTTVLNDSYLELPEDHADISWAVPIGEQVIIHGARSEDREEFPGELIAGFNFCYTWRSWRYGAPVQEVRLGDGPSNTWGDVLATDPAVFRATQV